MQYVVALVAVFMVLLMWVYYRELTRPEVMSDYYYDSGATMRLKSEPSNIDHCNHYDPRSAKDPRFFMD
jgi:hypothetical protein